MRPKQKDLVAALVAALEASNEIQRRKMVAAEAIAAALKERAEK